MTDTIRVTRDVRYGHHIGPCSEAEIGAGETAICVRSGDAHSSPMHICGRTALVLFLADDMGVDTGLLRRTLDGYDVLSYANQAHVCECRRRLACLEVAE